MAHVVWSVGVGADLVDFAAPTLRETIDQQLGHWMWIPGAKRAYVITDTDGVPVATMLRDEADPELAHVMLSDGTAETWRCTALKNKYDEYQATRFTPEGRPVNPRFVKVP